MQRTLLLLLLATVATAVAGCGLIKINGSAPSGGSSVQSGESKRAAKRKRMAADERAYVERQRKHQAARADRLASEKRTQRQSRAQREAARKLDRHIVADLNRYYSSVANWQPLLPGEIAITEVRIQALRDNDPKRAAELSKKLFWLRVDSASVDRTDDGKGLGAALGGTLVKRWGVGYQQAHYAHPFSVEADTCYLVVIRHPGKRYGANDFKGRRIVTKRHGVVVPFALRGDTFYSLQGVCAHRDSKAAFSYETNSQSRFRKEWTVSIVKFPKSQLPSWIRDTYVYEAPAECDVTAFKNLFEHPLPGLIGYVGNQRVAKTGGFLALSGHYLRGPMTERPEGPVVIGRPAKRPRMCRVPTPDKPSKKAFGCMARASGKYRSALGRAGDAYDGATSRKGRAATGKRYDRIEAASLEAQARCMPLMDKLYDWVGEQKDAFAKSHARQLNSQVRR